VKTHLEIDLAAQEGVAGVESVLADDKVFYILANKRESKLGYYLFTVDQSDPEGGSSPDSPAARHSDKYLINWNNKLDIANCAMHIMYDNADPKNGVIEGEDFSSAKTNPCIVICYKCIGINTFNVFVIDLNTKLIKYWHESN
jgi:hypothetical protein|tara:strand:- start:1363 stop:1791 length:429 start_codon:yes stop_codon:yes gene_type:complete